MTAATRLTLVWLGVAVSGCSPQSGSSATARARAADLRSSISSAGPQHVDTLDVTRNATASRSVDTVVVARGITCRNGFTPYALKQDWPWSVRAGALCIMPLPSTPWPWPPGRTTGLVVMPRTPFTPSEPRTAGVVVSGVDRSELEQARVLVGAVPYPKAKYLAIEGPFP